MLVESGIRNPESGKSELWNPESWALENGIQLKESGIPLTIGIRNPSSTDKESRIQYLKFRIHSMESRIQDCLGLPYAWNYCKENNALSWNDQAKENSILGLIERTRRDVSYVNQSKCHSFQYRSLVRPRVENALKVLNPFESSIQFYRVDLKKGYEIYS